MIGNFDYENDNQIDRFAPKLAAINAARSQSGALAVLENMTDQGLVGWMHVREPGKAGKIVAQDEFGHCQVTLYREGAESYSPLTIEWASTLYGYKKVTLDPAKFNTFEAEIWRRAVQFWKAFFQTAVRNRLCLKQADPQAIIASTN